MKSHGRERTSNPHGLRLGGLRLVTSLVTAAAKAYSPVLPKHLRQINHLVGALQSQSWGTAVRVADQLSKQQYESAAEHLAAGQLALLVKKVPFKDPSLDPEGLAIRKFKSSELRCKRINARFRNYAAIRHGMCAAMHARIPNLPALLRAQAWIRRVLGDEPNYEAILSRCDFGPGANVDRHGSDTTLPAKLGEIGWTVTPTCAPIAKAAFMSNPHLRKYLAEVADGVTYTATLDETWDACLALVSYNKVVMVPKTAMVHRAIAIEPLLNGYVQKGIEEYLKTLLKRWGINLRDQGFNQLLAKVGSEEWLSRNPFVTLDLSAASDSLAIEVVRLLLPPAWFSLLTSVRSPSYVLDGQPCERYHKFTSMGNGFCFPLESLIFAALVRSAYDETRDGIFSIYGDDIIVRRSAALRVIELLGQCGFKVNTDKSFVHGPFRESCGADYFGGVDVRPYTLDFIPEKPWEVIKIYNEWQKRMPLAPLGVDKILIDALKPEHRFMRYHDGPPDVAMTVPMDVFMGCRFTALDPDWCGWSYKGFKHSPVAVDPDRDTSLEVYSALRGYAADSGGHVAYSLRRKTRTRIVRYGSARYN